MPWRRSLFGGWLVAASAVALQAQGDSAAPVMAGLSNHGRTGSKPYVTAGTRTYVIGTQDGAFPDLGSTCRERWEGSGSIRSS